jgi:hypothetical protein
MIQLAILAAASALLGAPTEAVTLDAPAADAGAPAEPSGQTSTALPAVAIKPPLTYLCESNALVRAEIGRLASMASFIRGNLHATAYSAATIPDSVGRAGQAAGRALAESIDDDALRTLELATDLAELRRDLEITGSIACPAAGA